MHRRQFLAAGCASLSLGRWLAAQTPPEQVRLLALKKVQPATTGPMHHFFGYYDKCPWDPTQRYLLAHQHTYCDHQPMPGETVGIGMVDLQEKKGFQRLDETSAWSWQQGSMLQWLGKSDQEIIYNGTKGGEYAAVIRDVFSGKSRHLPKPIYAINHDATLAVTLDFDRLNRLRPGYGYMTFEEKDADDPAPKDKGIYRLDLKTGEHRLIVPLAQLAAHKPDARFANAQHWCNHLQFNPSASRFLFLHRWRQPGKGWNTRLFTATPEGSNLHLVLDTGLVSHFDWRDDRTILAWCRTKQHGDRFHLLDIQDGSQAAFAKEIAKRDGHCSYSPDRQWVLNDTYPDKERMQTLMLLRAADGRRIDLAAFFLPSQLKGPYRCDLHPRWSRDGTQLCIDSAHDGTRQLYLLDVGDLVQARQ